jgi:predicted amidophosphoribosyltransferase
VVRRIVDTESQTRKNRTERSDNMEGAFQLMDAAAIEGRHVLIIDDVVTTGATICSCVSEMQLTANCHVSILALGFTKS